MTAFPVRLPTFHGEPGQKGGEENWKAYKNAIELAYVVSNTKMSELTDQQRVAHLLSGLNGKAKKFLELHPEFRKQSYAEVDKAFSEKFGKASARHLLDINNIVQRPGESVMEYVARLKEAAEILQEDSFSPTIATQEQIENMDGEEVKRLNVFTQDEYNKARSLVNDAFNKLMMPHFLRGLKKEVRDVVMQSRPTTFEAALKTAEEYEKFTETFGSLSSSGNVSLLQAHDPSDTGIIDEVAGQLQGLNMKEREELNDKRNENMMAGNDPYGNMETRRCHYCQKIGHLKYQCRLRMSHYRENPGEYPPRYQPYPVEGRRNYNRPQYNDSRRYPDEGREYPRRTYSEDPRRSYRGDPRPQRYENRREDQQYAGSARMQPRMRNMRQPGVGGDRERDSWIAGEPLHTQLDPIIIKGPRAPRVSRNETDFADLPKAIRFPRSRSQEINREAVIGEINHQYIQRGRQSIKRGRSQGPKNGERRPLSRGPRIPSPRPYARSTQRR